MSKYICLVLTVALSAGLVSCEQKKTAAQIHAEKEAAWKAEKKERAVKFYRDLVQRYPDSPYAAQAKARLAALGAAGTPKPK